jgi:hypothetical protein
MKPLPNGKEETRTLRGTQGQGQYFSDPNIHREPGSQGISDGIEQIGINRNHSSQGSEFISRRERVTGGMLRQLISEYRNQVAIKKQEIQSLESRVEELELLQKDLEE